MKYILFLLLSCPSLLSGASFAEDTEQDLYLWTQDSLIFSETISLSEDSIPAIDDTDRDIENTIFIPVDCMPEFPGGHEAMKKFFAENLRYPERARKAFVEGRVVAQFIVGQDGRPSDIEIIQKVDPDLDREVIRLLSSMPYWTPCKARQRAVRVRYTFPFHFRLTEDTAD